MKRNQTSPPDVALSVYVVAHDWEYRDEKKLHPNIGSEVIAVRCEAADALKCRELCIREILQKLHTENFKTQMIQDEQGNLVIFSQPYGDWYMQSRKDRLLIEEFQLPISTTQLEELSNAFKQSIVKF